MRTTPVYMYRQKPIETASYVFILTLYYLIWKLYLLCVTVIKWMYIDFFIPALHPFLAGDLAFNLSGAVYNQVQHYSSEFQATAQHNRQMLRDQCAASSLLKMRRLTAVTCPWRSEDVLQSILIGRDMETGGMSALLIFKGRQVPLIVGFLQIYRHR